MTDKRSLWDSLPHLPLETGGVWDQIDKDARSRMVEPSSTGFDSWLAPGYESSGIWDEIDDETLLLRPEELDLWLRLERDARAISPGDESVWEGVEEETLLIRPQEADMWHEADDETLLLQPAAAYVWPEMRPGDLTRYKPQCKLGWALKPLTDIRGQPYFILKNVRSGTYLRLTPQQRFLWDLLDGQHSVQDIAIANLIEYKSFDVSGLLAFLEQLGAQGFLVNPRINLYDSVEETIAQRGLIPWLRVNLPRILELEFDIKGIDGQITRLYRLVGPVLFHEAVQLAMVMVTVSGLLAFAYQSIVAGYTPLGGDSRTPLWGLVGLYVVSAIVVLVHELSHALTCEHFGREVRRGGFMLYMGFPAWFVDTTDIWLSPRRSRILVSWAGPYSGLVLAGLCSLAVFTAPTRLVGGLLFQAAFSAYVLSLFNLNPLLKFDGYYILMDWLEIPRLRERAIEFVRENLWPKLRARERFSGEDRIFAIFGGLSLAWTAFAIGWAVVVWGGQLWRYIRP
jgi:putative peptide zinc metalloprotease protein